MAKITFIQPDGTQQIVEAESGMTVMEAAKKNLIDGIEAECGGACACATCHVYVDEAWREKVGGRLARWRRTCSTSPSTCAPSSRLSCQIKVTDGPRRPHRARAREAVLTRRGRGPTRPPTIGQACS